MNIIQSFNGTMAYIERTIETGCDEAEMARISGYSYPLFSRIFSILVGYPLNEYLRFRKLSRAAADLRNTDAKIIDIDWRTAMNRLILLQLRLRNSTASVRARFGTEKNLNHLLQLNYL